MRSVVFSFISFGVASGDVDICGSSWGEEDGRGTGREAIHCTHPVHENSPTFSPQKEKRKLTNPISFKLFGYQFLNILVFVSYMSKSQFMKIPSNCIIFQVIV